MDQVVAMRTTGRQQAVLFPLPMKGHMNPMLELGRMLHSKGFSVSVIHTEFNSPVPADNPMFTFHVISDGMSEAETSFRNVTAFLTTINLKCELPFSDCLSTLVADGRHSSTFLIVDPFWYFACVVAHSLHVPAVALMTFSAYCSNLLLDYRGSHWYLSRQEKDMEKVVAEFPPLRMKDMPNMSLQDPEQEDELMVKINTEMKKWDGIVFNTFQELESEGLAKFEKENSGIPLFPCGPLLEMAAPLAKKKNKCISWLDEQSPNSVIYISLGTIVSLTKSDFQELAWGIATSNHPFLWVVHPGLVREKESDSLPDWIMGKGLVVEWAPQKEVLAHPAVGAFLTHAGWNSTLESICAGVPMLCMPFFADQLANARVVGEVWKIGMYFEERIHRSTVQEAIRRFMQLHHKENGDYHEIRANIASLKDKAKHSLQLGGSSYKCLENLIEYLHQKH